MVGKTGPIVLLPAWERSHDLRIAIVQAKFDLGIAAARGWRLGRDRRRRRWAGEGPSPTGRFANRHYGDAGYCWDA